MHYEMHGEAGAPVVVLSHALAATGAMWQAQIGVLEETYRVLCYDIRGHGQSRSHQVPVCLDDLADDAEELLESLGLDQVQWVGSCLGGMIGQVLALRSPKRVAGLVLANSMAGLTEGARSAWFERIKLATEQGLEGLHQATLEEWFTESYRLREPQRLESSRRQILAGSATGYAGCCQAILGLDHLARLRELDLPTLVVVGAEDTVTPIPTALAMHERIAGSRLEILQSAAHLAVVEQASRFNQILLEFLR
jgi:3-oxoadipate enol-lactonase